MHIGWDISSIIYGTGVSRYTVNLIRNYLIQYKKDQTTLFGSSLRQKDRLTKFADSLSLPSNKKIFSFPPSILSILFNKLHLPIELFTGNLDIFHSWDWYTPNTKKASLVTTIHDLSALKYPQDTHPDIVKHHKQALKWVEKEAAAIIAVSESTKKDIINILGIDEKRVHVVYEALPQDQKINIPEGEKSNVLKKYSIDRPYFLAVGSEGPRKNLKRIIQAWQQMKKDFSLVVVGRSDLKDININKEIIFTGYLESRELAAIYSEAKCLVYPSLYEGFGLPILEAMYHKIPVVTSSISSMPEVAGDAAILVDPLKVTSIKEGINKAVKNKPDFNKKAERQLAKFSWQTVASQTHSVYKHVYETTK